MTPKSAELTAAAERVTRAKAGEALSEIYGSDYHDETLEYLFTSDKGTLADAYLATVAADDQRMRELLSRLRDVSSRIGLARHPLEIKGELDGLVMLYERALQPSEQETQS